jgi:hypothetical protein
MLERGFVAVSLADMGGSALTKKRRPESSTTLAICALARGAKSVAKADAIKTAQRTSVPRRVHPLIAARLIITILAPGKANFPIGVVSTTRRFLATPTSTVIDTAPSRSGSMSQ